MIKDIPSDLDWGEADGDLDKQWAYKNYFGKNLEQAKLQFSRNIIESSSELRFMPAIPFQFYIIAFRDFVIEKKFEPFDSQDAANCFLGIIKDMLENRKSDIEPVIQELMPSLIYVAENQELYCAPEHIYGDFNDLLAEIKELANISGEAK